MSEIEQLISQYKNNKDRMIEIVDAKLDADSMEIKQLNDDYDSVSHEQQGLDEKITKKVLAVKIMNNYEKAKAKGIKETFKFIAKYIYVNSIAKDAIETNYNDFKNAGKVAKVSAIFGLSLYSLLALMALPLTAPILVGFILFVSGKSAKDLYNQIKSAPEVETELKKSGNYDLIMENLEKFIKDDEEYLYENGHSITSHLLDEGGRKLV